MGAPDSGSAHFAAPPSSSLHVSLQPVGKASSGSSFLPNPNNSAVTFPWCLHSCFISHIPSKCFCRRKAKERLDQTISFPRLVQIQACLRNRSRMQSPWFLPPFQCIPRDSQGLTKQHVNHHWDFSPQGPWFTRVTMLSLLVLSGSISLALCLSDSHMHIQATLVAL